MHALQDAIKVTQKSAGSFETPKWDKTSQDKVRAALISLGSTIHGFSGGFGDEAADRSGDAPGGRGGGLGRESGPGCESM